MQEDAVGRAKLRDVAGETILVVDDEPQIREVLATYLEAEGYRVRSAARAAEAVDVAASTSPDLIILDLGLPDGNGYDVFRQVCRHRRIPTIMLTARSDEIDRVVGLELGADDYVTKPFSPREVIARVRAVLRRAADDEGDRSSTTLLRVRDLTVDMETEEARLAGEPLPLTPTEFRILAALARQAGRVLTRAQLLDLLQDTGAIFERTLDRHVANLRRKVEPDPLNPTYVTTVYGVGYTMRKA